jgi:uncharacterized protein (DUF1778 family)
MTMVDRKRKLVGSGSQHAIDADLDQLLFILDAEQHEAVVHVLDDPPPPNAALRELFTRKSPWERV